MKWTWCLLIAVGLCLVAGLPARAATTELVSVSSTGEQGDGMEPDISAGGRYVAFTAISPNLVPGDTNYQFDVLVHDRQTGATERVSVSSTGEEGNGWSYLASISADGRYVAFGSWASNLVPEDTNGTSDIFVHDRETGETERVSVSSAGQDADGASSAPAISADGRYVAFHSDAANLVPGDTNGVMDIFVHDRETGETERVSVSSAGQEADGASSGPAISADGRYVAFHSDAANLVPGDTNDVTDIFVHDMETGETERVSVSSAGQEADGASSGPAISADGRYVAFGSWASGLVPGDTNGSADIFVHDRDTGETERVSVSSTGQEGNGDSTGPYGGWPVVSADGRYVAFWSEASNLVAGDTNGSRDIFLHDRAAGMTERVSVSSTGQEGNGHSTAPAISADGRYVAFESAASGLVPGTSGGVFVRDRVFADVPSDHWAYDEIMACFNANIVKGYDDGLYHPEGQITRDQMAVYVARALVSPSGDAAIPDPTPPPAFSDVPPIHWAYKHIEYAVSQNVVQGYEDGTYGPDITLDRGQMAVFIARAMVAPGGDGAIPEPVPPATFPDVASTFWGYKQVEYCVGQDVVKGYDDGLYHPDYPCTRDQMAVYIARAFGLL